MRLLKLQVRHVRSIQGPVALELGPGLNVVHGPNETGKSTLFDAAWAALHIPARSTRAEVEALRPWSGEAPEVTVEFESGGQTYELYKKWSGAGTVRLARRGDAKVLAGAEAEAALAKLLGTDDKSGGTWPLLRVRQGDNFARVAEMLPSASREGLAKNLSGLAVAGTGMEGVLAEVAEEYGHYFTEKGAEKRAAGAPLVAAKARLAEAERTLAELVGRRTLHEQELRDWERLVDEVEKLKPQRPLLAKRLEEATAAAEQVKGLFARREVVAGELRTAVLREQTALEKLNRRRNLRRKLAEEEGRLEAKRAEAERAQRDADFRRGQVPGLETALDAATGAQAEAERRCEGLRLRDELLRVEADLARHDALLAEARRTFARIAELEPVLATLRVDAGMLRRLEELDVQKREAAARLQAASTTVRIRALRELPLAIAGETLSLGGGEALQRELSSPGLIRVGELAEIEILPGGAELARYVAEHRELEARLARGFEHLAVSGLEDARAAAERRRTVDEELGRLRQETKRRFPGGLAPLEQERTRLAGGLELARTRPCTVDLDADAVARELPAAVASLAQSKAAVESARAGLDAARRALVLLEKTEGTARTEVKGIETALATSRAELDRAVEGEGADLALEQAVTAASTARKEQEGVQAGIDVRLDELGREQAYARRTAAQAALDELDATLQAKGTQKLQSEARLGHAEVGNLHGVANAEGAVADARAAVDGQEAQARAVKLLAQVLEACQADAKSQLIEPMQAAVVPILERILGPVTLGLDQDLEIREVVRSDGAAAPEVLSQGAREQVSMAVRLAMAKTLAGDDQLPLLLDDALVWSDPVRFDNVVDVLASLTDHLQVIVATCHPERWSKVAASAGKSFDLAALKVAPGGMQAAG